MGVAMVGRVGPGDVPGVRDSQEWGLPVVSSPGDAARAGKAGTAGYGSVCAGWVARTSLVGVATFLVVAIVTANVVAALGVVP